MREIGQSVDDRTRRVLREIGDGLVRERARHDAVDVAPEDFGGVVNRLAASDLDVARRQKERLSAKLIHPGLERHASSRR